MVHEEKRKRKEENFSRFSKIVLVLLPADLPQNNRTPSHITSIVDLTAASRAKAPRPMLARRRILSLSTSPIRHRRSMASAAKPKL
jgi:hypothetical protein